MAATKIFGEHDDRTKEQLARCMQYGSVAGGVLYAGSHLGYAQPVGGVIACDEHVSVSGVGFDIACGNMAVKLDLPKAAIADRIGPLVAEVAASMMRRQSIALRANPAGRENPSTDATNPARHIGGKTRVHLRDLLGLRRGSSLPRRTQAGPKGGRHDLRALRRAKGAIRTTCLDASAGQFCCFTSARWWRRRHYALAFEVAESGATTCPLPFVAPRARLLAYDPTRRLLPDTILSVSARDAVDDE
jgi:hypothetical protein